jgi:hypothetical protein
VNKIPDLQHEITSTNLDLCALTETWLRPDDQITPNLVPPTGYNILSSERTNAVGGGLGVVFKDHLAVKVCRIYTSEVMECTSYSVRIGTKLVHLAVVYRPPDGSVLAFAEGLADFMEQSITIPGDLLILGDFNVHFNKPEVANTIIMSDFLESFNLKNFVNFPTHKSQNVLDVVITDSENEWLCDVRQGSLFSDHFMLYFDINLNQERNQREITFRKTKNIDNTKFSEDIQHKLSTIDTSNMSVDQTLEMYNYVMTEVLDQHAPLKKKTVPDRPKLPWFDEGITSEIRLRRKMERRWKKDHTNCEKFIEFYRQRRKVSNQLDVAEKAFYKQRLAENKYNYKQVFTICNKLLNRNADLPLPETQSTQDLADGFNRFFLDKIGKLRTKLEEGNNNGSSYHSIEMSHNLPPEDILNFYEQISEKNLCKVINNAKSKSCELDPVPTTILKDNLDATIAIIAQIVNKSTQTGVFPSNEKQAIIRPLLKKANLELTMKNYRPVSNLSFISKLIERVVVMQITEHIAKHNFMEENQSAYRAKYSTETTLLKVKSDILRAMDNKKVCCLVLLDLSAAFDTIDREILLHRLETRFGISGTALKWLSSYLEGRSQKVVIGNPDLDGAASKSEPLLFGVPQGSVLGPILFTLYTTPLGDICRKHGIKFQLYADDTQLYLTFKPISDAQHSCMQQLENCIKEIRLWMRVNMLCLNDSKTEFMVLGTRQQLAKVKDISIKIGDVEINPVSDVRNLGYYLDRELKSHTHINKISCGSFLMLRNIKKIRCHLDQESTKTLVQALILSRLDYCNSLLAGSPTYQLHKLQRMQNMCCRVIYNLRKFDHISPYLRELHWLKIKERIDYKIATLVFKCNNDLAPSYLADLLPKRSDHGRNLRSKSYGNISCGSSRTSRVQNGSFSFVGPKVWNNLPAQVKLSTTLEQFQKRLKTHLFTKSHF